jgi:murein DD-endopeptidase MepM/ murein hydrolase activator NlpD
MKILPVYALFVEQKWIPTLTLALGLLIWVGGGINAQGGKEKGSFKTNPKIPVNTSMYEKKKKNDEFDAYLPSLQFQTQYENVERTTEYSSNNTSGGFKPTKDENPMASAMDTTSRDEGETLIVEVEDQMQVLDGEAEEASEEWTSIASYYSIWDTRQIDPYGIEELDEPIDLQLYDKSQGRYFSMPLNENKITSPFGPRWGRLHAGVDLDLNTGDPVYTTFDGIVRVVGWDGGGYGNFVVVRHYNGLETLYGHLSRATVEPNTYVKAQDMIGLGGNTGRSTGSHLHFETRFEGNPFAPTHVFSFASNTVLEHFILTPSTFTARRLENEYGSAGSKRRYRRVAYVRARSGDSLSSIAARAGISVERLARLNGMRTGNTLRSGRRLRIR